MTRRTKLELGINRPVTVELLFDEPIIGESKFGSYFMYAVSVDGSEYSYFAPEEVHDELYKLCQGDTATITKHAVQKGSKIVTKYSVASKQSVNAVGSNKTKSEAVSIGEVIKEILPNESSSDEDKFFAIMKRSYTDALRINTELNGMADPARIAITLFIARSKSA